MVNDIQILHIDFFIQPIELPGYIQLLVSQFPKLIVCILWRPCGEVCFIPSLLHQATRLPQRSRSKPLAAMIPS